MKNTSEAISYAFSPNNSDTFFGFNLQFEDDFNKFLYNLNLNIYEGIKEVKNSITITLMPGIGYILIGDSNSKHKLSIKLSAGLITLRQNDIIKNSFGSETNLEYRFNNFAFDLGLINLNSNLNEYIKIGFRYYN